MDLAHDLPFAFFGRVCGSGFFHLVWSWRGKLVFSLQLLGNVVIRFFSANPPKAMWLVFSPIALFSVSLYSALYFIVPSLFLCLFTLLTCLISLWYRYCILLTCSKYPFHSECFLLSSVYRKNYSRNWSEYVTGTYVYLHISRSRQFYNSQLQRLQSWTV